MSSLFLSDAGEKCLRVFREKVLNVWAKKFPRLVSRDVQVLMAHEKFRPDVSSTDCVTRATAQAEKVYVEMFDVTDVEKLDNWMHVCCVSVLVSTLSTPCGSQPKDHRGEPVRDSRLRARRRAEHQQYYDRNQDYCWTNLVNKAVVVKKKKRKRQREITEEEKKEMEETQLERFVRSERRVRKKTQKMLTSIAQEKCLDLKPRPRKRRRKK